MFDSLVRAIKKPFMAAEADPFPELTNKDNDNRGWVGRTTGYQKTNRYVYYQQLLDSSELASSILRGMVSMFLEGLRFDSENEALAQDFNDWAFNTGFKKELLEFGQYCFRDGTFIAAGGGDYLNFTFTPMLMENVTILPAGIKPKEAAAGKLLKAPAVQILLNEIDPTSTVIPFDPFNVIYVTFERWRKKQLDNMGRNTHGLYGTSLLIPIERHIRAIKLLDEIDLEYMQQAGLGTLLVDMPDLYADLAAKKITSEAADGILASMEEKIGNKAANDILVTYGCKFDTLGMPPSPLDPISLIKRHSEAIRTGMHSTDLTQGDSKGSTYAAGSVSQNVNFLTLEGVREVVLEIVRQCINLRLRVGGKEPGLVWAEVDPLRIEPLAARDLLEMINSGNAPREELAKRYNIDMRGIKE